MSRPVAIRVSHRNDVGFLLRLEAAVAKDERHSQRWRDAVVAKIRELAMLLLAGESTITSSSDTKVAPAGPARSAKAAAR